MGVGGVSLCASGVFAQKAQYGGWQGQRLQIRSVATVQAARTQLTVTTAFGYSCFQCVLVRLLVTHEMFVACVREVYNVYRNRVFDENNTRYYYTLKTLSVKNQVKNPFDRIKSHHFPNRSAVPGLYYIHDGENSRFVARTITTFFSRISSTRHVCAQHT